MTLTLKEAYAGLGGDYEKALARLFSEKLMRKYLRMFPDDDSFPNLKAAFEEGERLREAEGLSAAEEKYREAFDAAHALKGVALNLGMDDLGNSSSALCESLRHGFTDTSPALYRFVERDYGRALEIIREIGA